MADCRRHVLGVERARDGERDEPGLGGRVGGERLELLDGAGGDDLARSVVVGRGEALASERCEHLVTVTAEDGGHAGRVTAAASAIARPRSRTRTMASSEDSTPDRAAAASSPTLWPATTPTWRAGSARSAGGRERRGDQQGLGDRGVADLVGVGLGAEWARSRSEPRRANRAGRRRRASSNQGVRKPGAWAPSPGATMTSTSPLSRVGAGFHAQAPTKLARSYL